MSAAADFLPPSPWTRLRLWRPILGLEAAAASVVLWWALTANRGFLAAMAAQADHGALTEFGLVLALGAAVWALHLLLLLAVAARAWFKPLVLLLTLMACTADWFIRRYGVVLDSAMVRNALATHPGEAAELLVAPLFMTLAWQVGLPAWWLWRLRLQRRSWRRAMRARLAWLGATAAVLVGALAAAFPVLAPTMRQHRELRYMIAPANVLWSTAKALAGARRDRSGPRLPIGLDARMEPPAEQRSRPRLVVWVVGETVRAANWGLNGYARQTTPELAKLELLNFPNVTACGTDTETSLPCMFAPVGRRQYDERRIRGSESLLNLLHRAGVAVYWHDNQSGCKGVCDGLPAGHVVPRQDCAGAPCLDAQLLEALPRQVERAAAGGGTHLLVLHPIGNHGPAYWRRYPPQFERFVPACRHDDLHRCNRQEIVNAYDNAVLYTDALLAGIVDRLKAATQVDSALLYVSDHGESLGESRLYLHGLPWTLAPDVQRQVPMVMWLSEGTRKGLDAACLQRLAASAASHDHLFHTVSGLLGVQAREVDRQWDLLAPCRQ